MWCPLVVVTHLGAAMTLMMLCMSVSIAANCTFPSMLTACGGLELTLANCSLSSSVAVTRPSNTNAYCGNITIVLSSVSFVGFEDAMISFRVPAASYRNITIRVERSFIQGSIASWGTEDMPTTSVANLSVLVANTTVEARGATQWLFLVGCVSSEGHVNFTLDRVHINVVQTAVNFQAIVVRSPLFDATATVAFVNSMLGCHTAVVALEFAHTLSLSNFAHVMVNVLGGFELFVSNTLINVVQDKSSSILFHEAALVTIEAYSGSPNSLQKASAVFTKFLTVTVERTQLHLEGSARSSVVAGTAVATQLHVRVTITVTDSEVTLITKGNVSTLTPEMLQSGVRSSDVTYSRHSAIVDLPTAPFIDTLNVTLLSCIVTLVVVVDNNATANGIFDDSVPSFEIDGAIVSKVSNARVIVINTTFGGGIFQRFKTVPYVTIGCTHVMSVVSLFGCNAQVINLIITNVTISYVDNVSYTAANPFVAAQIAGLGSVAITMATVLMDMSISHSTIDISNTVAHFDVTNVNYFAEPKRGGLVAAMVIASPATYDLARRDEISELLKSLLLVFSCASGSIQWTDVDLNLHSTSLSFAPLDRLADAEHMINVAAVTGTVVFAVSSGFLSGGLTVDGLQLTVVNSTVNFSAPTKASLVVPSAFVAHVWLHSSGDVVAHVSVASAHVVSDGALVPPLLLFTNASFALSTVSLSGSTVSAPLSAASMAAPFALLLDAVNTTVRDSALVVSNTQFTAGSGGVLFGSGIVWGKNATVGLVCGTTWNGLPLRPRIINVPVVVLKASEARRRQGQALLPRAVGCPQPEAQVMYSYSATAEATATLGIEAPRSAVRSPVQPATIVVASFTLALVPSVATVVPGLQVVSQLSIARRMCAASVGGGGEPHPLSDAASNPLPASFRHSLLSGSGLYWLKFRMRL